MHQERAQELRRAIDRLPLVTRQSMLQGIQKHRIIVGADANLTGRCPILAASGSATEAGRPFARAWDRYARARLPRVATERELLTLRSMLVTSIESERPAFSVQRAIASRRLAERRGFARDATPVPHDTTPVLPRQTAEQTREAAREVRHALRELRQAPRRSERVVKPLPAAAPEPEPEREVRYSAAELMPAARVAAVKARARAKARAEAEAKAQAEARARAEAEAARRRPLTGSERERARELAACEGWSWPADRYDDYERALRDLERELEAVERTPDSELAHLDLAGR